MSKEISPEIVGQVRKILPESKWEKICNTLLSSQGSEGGQRLFVQARKDGTFEKNGVGAEQMSQFIRAIGIVSPDGGIEFVRNLLPEEKHFGFREAMIAGLLYAGVGPRLQEKDDSLFELLTWCCQDPSFYLAALSENNTLGQCITHALGEFFAFPFSDSRKKATELFFSQMIKRHQELKSAAATHQTSEATGHVIVFEKGWPGKFIKSIWFKWATYEPTLELLAATQAYQEKKRETA